MRFQVLTNDGINKEKFLPVIDALEKLPVRGQLEIVWDEEDTCTSLRAKRLHWREKNLFKRTVRKMFPKQFVLSRFDQSKRYVYTRKAMPTADATNES